MLVLRRVVCIPKRLQRHSQNHCIDSDQILLNDEDHSGLRMRVKSADNDCPVTRAGGSRDVG